MENVRLGTISGSSDFGNLLFNGLPIQICEQSIIDYKKNVKPGSRKDTLSSLIQAKDKDGHGLSDEELVGASFVVMFGGRHFLEPNLTKALIRLRLP